MTRRRLTERQRTRIAAIQDRRKARFDDQAEAAVAESAGQPVQQGAVITRHGRNLAVEDAEGALTLCQFRQNLGQIVCGDRVLWQRADQSTGIVTALLPRDSVLARPDFSGREKPLAANIDQLVVLMAPRPEPVRYLLDQYLVTAEAIGVKALIALTKADTLNPAERRTLRDRFSDYAAIGYPLLEISARDGAGLEPIRTALRGHSSILVGQSGVGKSSLVQALLPDREIQVGRLSEATGLGRHTTSSATRYRLSGGGVLIDSPGVRSFRLGKLDRQQLEHGFRELAPFLSHCRFHNCTHDHEPGCAVREAVEQGRIHPERLANFLHMLRACR